MGEEVWVLRGVGNRQWAMGNGEWGVESEQAAMGFPRWRGWREAPGVDR